MPAKKTDPKNEKRPIREVLGKVFSKNNLGFLGGLLGGSMGNPVAGAVVGKKVGDIVGDLLGIPRDQEEASEAEVEAKLAETSPENLIALRQIEAEAAKSELAHTLGLAEEDTARIESVNETMRSEVSSYLTNPLAGMWRPIWGIIGAMVWGAVMAGTLILSGLILFKQPELLIVLFPQIANVQMSGFVILGAILGVSAWKRGSEKNTIAEGIKEVFTPGSLWTNRESATDTKLRATPVKTD